MSTTLDTFSFLKTREKTNWPVHPARSGKWDIFSDNVYPYRFNCGQFWLFSGWFSLSFNSFPKPYIKSSFNTFTRCTFLIEMVFNQITIYWLTHSKAGRVQHWSTGWFLGLKILSSWLCEVCHVLSTWWVLKVNKIQRYNQHVPACQSTLCILTSEQKQVAHTALPTILT